MASKGTPVYTLRIPNELAAEIETTINRRNIYTLNEPWHWSGFVLTAIREKLNHMERSRRAKKRKAVQHG